MDVIIGHNRDAEERFTGHTYSSVETLHQVEQVYEYILDTHTHVHMVYTHTHTLLCKYKLTHKQNMCVCMYLHFYTQSRTHTRTHTHTCRRTHVLYNYYCDHNVIERSHDTFEIGFTLNTCFTTSHI